MIRGKTMDAVTLCCNNAYSGGLEPSPFERLIAIEYYDGPTKGVIQCRDCDQAYMFTMLEIDDEGKYDTASWDEGREIRIFGLSYLPASSFEDLIAVCSRYMAPKWPIWVPLHRTTHTGETLNVLESEIARVLDVTRDLSLVVATHGLLVDVIAARNISEVELVEKRDWFFFLGLAEGPTHVG
jgi:hypothetical protein